MAHDRIRVMHSIAPPEPGKTRFIDHLMEGAPPGVEVQTFTWRRAWMGQFDIFHVHWPERLLRKGWLKTMVLLLLLKARRIPIVRTLHNVDPHEAGTPIEAVLLRLIDRSTTGFVRLNSFTPLPAAAFAATVRHPHYLPRVKHTHRMQTGRILYFGIVRPYKGIDDLLVAFESVSTPGLTLRIVGSATGDRGDGVRAAVAADSRITARLAYVPDAELDDEIRQAELIVLPYRKMHNSGAVFLALSHRRPVLVPRSDVNEEISQEVGEGWVYQFDGDLSASDVEEAVASVRSAPSFLREPDLAGRAWGKLGEELRDFYRTVLTQ